MVALMDGSSDNTSPNANTGSSSPVTPVANPLPKVQTASVQRSEKQQKLMSLRKFSFMGEIPSLQTAVPQVSMGAGPERKNSSAGSMKLKSLEETVFELFKDEKSQVHVGKFLNTISALGIGRHDKRLTEMRNELHRVQHKRDLYQETIESMHLNKEDFVAVISKNIVFINRVLHNEVIIPDWAGFVGIIEDIYRRCKANDAGKVADYIPQLAKADPNCWGLAVCTVDGQRLSLGDAKTPVCLQSVSKALNYALALQDRTAADVHKYIGMEPSGRIFNELVLDMNQKPHNPMINAGAICTCSLVQEGRRPADRYEYVQNFYKRMAGYEYVGFDNAVYLSERETADRNYALAHYMRENKCFPDGTNLDETLNLYFQLCSCDVTCESGAVMAATLANGGICPVTEEDVINANCVRDVLSLMYSCGMYDYSGQFAFKELISTFNFHNYDNLKHGTGLTQKIDPRRRKFETKGQQVVDLLFCAANGDVSAMRKYLLRGFDLGIADYDRRTALHLAAAEGHADVVQFLLEKGQVDPASKDRWGHTPHDDAKAYGHKEICDILENWQRRQEGADSGCEMIDGHNNLGGSAKSSGRSPSKVQFTINEESDGDTSADE